MIIERAGWMVGEGPDSTESMPVAAGGAKPRAMRDKVEVGRGIIRGGVR